LGLCALDYHPACFRVEATCHKSVILDRHKAS